MPTEKLSHINIKVNAKMVNVSSKPDTIRIAIASGEIILREETIDLIRKNELKKGDVLSVARIAGIMAAKRTSDLIPLCHLIPIHQIEVDFKIDPDLPGIRINANVQTTAKTGVEMEALTAVSVAALTIYDMVKAVDKKAMIQNVRLVEKHGGLHGDVINV